MTARPLLIALLVSTVACVTGCTTAYRNGQSCKDKMIATYPASEPRLSYEVPRVAYKGSRVVIGATYPDRQDQLIAPTEKKGSVATLKTTSIRSPAAVECTFDGDTLLTFRWLTPAKFAAVYDDAKPAE